MRAVAVRLLSRVGEAAAGPVLTETGHGLTLSTGFRLAPEVWRVYAEGLRSRRIGRSLPISRSSPRS